MSAFDGQFSQSAVLYKHGKQEYTRDGVTRIFYPDTSEQVEMLSKAHNLEIDSGYNSLFAGVLMKWSFIILAVPYASICVYSFARNKNTSFSYVNKVASRCFIGWLVLGGLLFLECKRFDAKASQLRTKTIAEIPNEVLS